MSEEELGVGGGGGQGGFREELRRFSGSTENAEKGGTPTEEE